MKIPTTIIPSPGFLPHGAVVPLLIGHKWSEVPVGKGRIRSEPDGGYYDFELANTHAGQELAEWLRHDIASYEGPVSEWSYGFTPFPDAISRRHHQREIRPGLRAAGGRQFWQRGP